jgi:predicted Zn-dependent protease
MALPATCKTSTNAPTPLQTSIKPMPHALPGTKPVTRKGSRPKVTIPQWYRATAFPSYANGGKSRLQTWGAVDMSGDCRQLEGGDYLPEMIEGGLQRWPGHQFPLRVYVEQSGGAGYRAHLPAMVQQAMNSWTAVSQNKLSFVLVSDPASANISVQWVPYSTATECGDTVTNWTPDANGNQWITHAAIKISTWSNNGATSDREIAKCTLHELGHALGLKHSSNPGDIMYHQSNGAQVATLGQRDATTINRLYGIN